MKKSKIALFLFVIVLLSFIAVMGQDDNCDECIEDPSKCCDRYPELCLSEPGRDEPDDNFSFSDFMTPFVPTGKGTLSILNRGYWRQAEKLFANFSDNINLINIAGITNPEYIIIPSGAFFGKENDTTLRYILDHYVRQGGTLIVFTQQYGSHIEPIVPGGETLEFFGWRQDQNCINGSVYFDTMHPVVSSSTAERVTAAVDGYIASWPSNGTVILQRTKNNEAAILHYPYGNGHVILTGLYTDWGYSRSQASRAEMKIVRDLITFAKDPSSPIPMFNLDDDPTPQVNLNLKVTNRWETTAVRAKIAAYTPDNNTLLYETMADVNLGKDQETSIPVSFTLPQLQSGNYGICHLYYELYDSDNNTVQYLTESTSGRFAIYNVTSPFTNNGGLKVWITAQDEIINFSEPAQLKFHIKNNTSQAQTVDLEYTWNHDTIYNFIDSATVPAESEVALDFSVNAPSYAHFLSFYRGNVSMRFRLKYGDGQTGQFREVTKGITFKTVDPDVSVFQVLPTEALVGTPVTYTFEIKNETEPAPVELTVSAVLEKIQWPENTYGEITTIYNAAHTLAEGETLSVSDSYLPEQLHEGGQYRIKLMVQKPGGSTDEYFAYFLYKTSNIWPRVEPLENSLLQAGVTYPVNVNLIKRNDFPIANGKYSLVFRTREGQEVCRKDVANLTLIGTRTIQFEDTVIFSPSVFSPYYRLTLEYSDETMQIPRITDSRKIYRFNYVPSLSLDKETYQYRDTANVSLNIRGAGTFDVHFTCGEAGIDEIREVQVPAGTFDVVEVFQVPIGFGTLYTANVAITSRDGFYAVNDGTLSIPIIANPLVIDTRGTFGDITAAVGQPIDFTVTLKGISGFTSPLPGTLSVGCIGYTDSKNVTLSPVGENTFAYSIPVPESTLPDIYYASILFTVEDRQVVSESYPIKIPSAELTFSRPDPALDAGDTVTLTLQNSGGKNGSFNYNVFLKDKKGNAVAEHSAAFAIASGQQEEISITIPGDAGTGSYILHQEATETHTNREFISDSLHQVTGLSASLDSYPSKETYLNDEAVTGKAEITAGSGGITAGVLQAQIVRRGILSGVKEFQPGEFLNYNSIEAGYDAGAYLYMVTDKGVIKFEKSTGTVEMRYAFDGSNPDFNAGSLLVSANGDIWIPTTYGVYMIDNTGQWTQFTTADGLANNWIYDILEISGTGETAIWAATGSGISVYRGGQWSTTYTTADGLPHNRVYRMGVGSDGIIWVSTNSGICRFNETAGQFEDPSAPFGDSSVTNLMAVDQDGHVWAAVSAATGDYTLYRYSSGTWDQWRLNDLYAPYKIFIHEMEIHNGRLWLKANFTDGELKIRQMLIHDDGSGNFSFFNSVEHRELGGLFTPFIFPGASDNAYFMSEVGYVAYDGSDFTAQYIDIDRDKLLGNINCMTTDSLSRLWLGTEAGVSMYDGTRYTHYFHDPDHQKLTEVNSIAVGPGDTVIVNNPVMIWKITGAGLSEMAEFPDNDYYYMNHLSLMTVDTAGRVWIGLNNLHYYDPGSGQWQEISDLQNPKTLTQDREGGVWVGNVEHSPEYAFHLRHIKNDLTSDDYTHLNSGLIEGEKDHLWVDDTGRLWINTFNYKSRGYTDNPMQSFDGLNWIDYRGFENFPADEQYGITRNGSGNIVLIALRDNQEGVRLFTLSDGKFAPGDQKTGFVPDWGKFLFAGGKYYGVNGNLAEISAAGGIGEEILWSRSYPLDLAGGAVNTLDIGSGSAIQPGFYFLKTAVLSQSTQVLAEDSSPFSVGDNQLSITLTPSGSVTFEGAVKPGTQLPVTLKILNNTMDDKNSLQLTLQKSSPSGVKTELLSETLDLSAGQSITRSIAFNESGLGTWKLSAQLYSGNSGGGGGEGGDEALLRIGSSDEVAVASEGEEPGNGGTPTTGELLGDAAILIDVAQPSAMMTIQSPEYAGDEAFDVIITLTNDSAISSSLTMSAASGGSSLLDESLTLKPGEKQLISFKDTINTDKTYNVVMSGDVSKNESITVKYGYNETLTFNALPSYREGPVTIGYTIGNDGGLPFSDTLHMELFAVGGSAPLYTFDRTYNLYPMQPEEQPISDSLDLNLTPGNYILKSSSGKLPAVQEILFTVNPSGIGMVTLADTTAVYPVGSGAESISFTLTNSDTAAGAISLSINITGPQGPVSAENRSYFLQPGQTLDDFIAANFAVSGNYTVNITGSKLSAPVSAVLQAADLEEANAAVTIDAIVNGQIPVNVSLENTGYFSFNGTVSIQVQPDGFLVEQPVEVTPGTSVEQTAVFSTSHLTAGEKTISATVYGSSGELISEATGSVTVVGPVIELDIPGSGSVTVDAGAFVNVPLTVRNSGHQRGEVILDVSALESLNRRQEIHLEPGQEIILENITVDAASDLPSGEYPFHYSISGAGVPGGSQSGNFNITVNGLDIDVNAALDRSLYNQGETAILTVTVITNGTSDAPLEAVINWGNFNERRQFNLSTGSAALNFDIPLDEQRDEKIFYGIYHDGGKGIHLNDIYLNFMGDVNVEVDKQVYAPGEIIQAVFTSQHSGVLTTEAFGESHTVNLPGSVSASFQVPQDTLGGTYGVNWTLAPADTGQNALSGSRRFDVSGLEVKTAKSELDRGKYIPGETVTATYLLESNQNTSLEMRCWITSPSGEWQFLGSDTVTVSAAQLTETQHTFSFDTTEAGTHEWVYGLYKPGAIEAKPVLSGRMAFDVGEAVLMGVTTDKYEYTNGAQPVNAHVHYFGLGSAQLELYLDDEKIEERSLSINGVGSTGITIAASRITGGDHSLRAVLTKDGLTSTKTSGFIYGTELPDLTLEMLESDFDDLDYTYRIAVINSGKSASAASSVTFSDNGSVIQTLSVPALQPAQAHEVTVTWSGSGKAGSHDFVFNADSDNTVKEYSESNNSLEFSEEIPTLFYTLEAEPAVWPANFNATLITRLVNNQDSALPVTLEMTITNNETNEEIFQRDKTDQLPAFGSKSITDTFNSGVYAAGSYTIRQTLSGPSVDEAREIGVTIEADKSVEASLTTDPITIPSDTPAETTLTLGFSNTGNVPWENDVLMIEVFDTGLEEVVKTEEYVLNLAIAETRTDTTVLPLTLGEGQYEIRLKHEESVLASAGLTSAPGLEREKTIAVSPRPLIMNLPPIQQHNAEVQFFTGLFSLLELEYDLGTRHTNSFVKLHSGHSNITVVLGKIAGFNRWQELQERVWSGEGLILVCDRPLQENEIARFLGLKIRPVPGREREKHIAIEASDLGNGGDVTMVDKIKRCIAPLPEFSEEVVILAKTKQYQRPVMALRKYGQGHVMVISVPLRFVSGGETAAQLIGNAVTLLSRDVYSQSDISRVLPVGMSLTNKSSKTLSLTVKEILPYGVEAYGFVPEPEPKSSAADDTVWNVELGAATQKMLFYWLRLPNSIGSYEAQTKIFEGEAMRDEVSVTFDVGQTVEGRIDELIHAIEMVDASGSDGRYLNKAKMHLQRVRRRNGCFIGALRANVRDMVFASANLGKVENTDVSSLRLQAIALLRILARIHYDKAVN